MPHTRPNASRYPQQTAPPNYPPPVRSTSQHTVSELFLQQQQQQPLIPHSRPSFVPSKYPPVSVLGPDPLLHLQPGNPNPNTFQVDQFVHQGSLDSTSTASPFPNPHQYLTSPAVSARPRPRPPPLYQSNRTSSPYPSPQLSSSADHSLHKGRRTSGPAPPRNVMMMGEAGGVAVLHGPIGLQNIQDPYAVRPMLHSGEVGRPTFNNLRGSSTSSSSRLISPSTSLRREFPIQASSSRASSSSISQQHQARSNPAPTSDHRLSNTSGPPSPSTTKVSKPYLETQSEQSGSTSILPDEDTWGSMLTSKAAAFGGNENGAGSSFGSLGGGNIGDWTSSGRNGVGGSGDGNGGGSDGFGNGGGQDGGNNGDGNDGRGSPSSKEKDKAAKKANPLVDLIETETAYVSELSKIIKKVAGAWSRSNFPPAELDTMFRNIESIYRVNRSFLKSLKEIGPNPSSPRALGDLLMRWIDDLEAPYLRYCDNYFSDFDNWATVQGNTKLPPLLESVSEIIQPDGSPIIFSDKKRQAGQIWTLDQLFALPQIRLKYYKKLYSRLLKSTQSGRSDHRLLVGANEKLDELLQRSKKRIAMSVLDDGPIASNARHSQESSIGEVTSTERNSANNQTPSSRTSLSTDQASSSKEEFVSQSKPIPLNLERSYSPLPALPPSGAPSPSFAASRVITSPLKTETLTTSNTSPVRDAQLSTASHDLEVRLDTSRTLDIFTLKPKKCQLRMNPPNIPFTRSLRKSDDVVIYFTPSCTGQEIVLRRAHIVLLTDLFLVCERMSPHERAERGGPADMWLLYPPLAGKHLKVADNGPFANSITIQILKKETLTVHLSSREAKLEWIMQFDQCNKFANSIGLQVKTSSDPETGSPNSGGPSIMSPRDGSFTLGQSPAISVTPSSRLDDEEDNSMVKDMTKLVEELMPFSPDESGSLTRSGSFKSFVMPPIQRSMIQEGEDERGQLNGAISPAMTSAFARSPEALSPTYPPNPYSVNNGPPPPRLNSLPPHLGSEPFGVGPNMAVSPPTGPMRMPNQGYRPPNVMGMRPPPPVSQGSISNGPPLPAFPPPLHLMNGAQRPNRPPPHMNGPLPSMVNASGPGGPNLAKSMPPRPPYIINNGQGDMSARPSQEPSKRPSAPDLRSRSKQDAMRRASEENVGIPGRSRSASGAQSGPPKLPSDFLKQAGSRPTEQYSPPSSPRLKNRGPKTSTVAAQMRCRLYLKQSHAQWKSLGNARVKVFHLMPDDVKQMVVENDKKQTPIISSIILPDGVERVGKVGVAIELSDNGNRTGIVYMIHLRSEESAVALFGQLLEGSDRTVLSS